MQFKVEKNTIKILLKIPQIVLYYNILLAYILYVSNIFSTNLFLKYYCHGNIQALIYVLYYVQSLNGLIINLLTNIFEHHDHIYFYNE